MKKRLREYDEAWNAILGRAIDGFIRSHDLLGGIGRYSTQHVGPIRNVREPRVLDQPGEHLRAEASLREKDVRACDVNAHTLFVYELASANVRELAKLFFRTADKITEAAGTVQDADGRPLSWDLILETLEQMPISFERDGTPRLPQLVVHPDVLANLAPMTDEERTRQSEIVRRKQVEHAAAKRTRRLSR